MAKMVSVHWQGDYTDIHGDGRYGNIDVDIPENMWYRIQNDRQASEELIKRYVVDCGKAHNPYFSFNGYK